MPKLVRNLRQRERVLDRVWNPIAPYFLTYSYGGALYSRTYTYHAPVNFNQIEPVRNAHPFGFYFEPAPQPPLVPIHGAYTLDTFNSPPVITPPPPPVDMAKLLQIDDGVLLVGLTSKPLRASPQITKRITLLAPSSNLGTVYVSGAKNTPAGLGFPLVPGAAKDYGELSSDKVIDMSTFFVIGTDINDKVYLDPES